MCLVALMPASAKQVMTMLNGDEIEVEIVAIGASEISYKKASNPKGPTYKISRDEVFFILYENGQREVITQVDQSGNTVNEISQNQVPQQGIINSLQEQELDVEEEKDYFPNISFYPRAMVGFHATPSGYKDSYDVDWGGLYWSFDFNVLLPINKGSAWTLGLGLASLSGEMRQLYMIGDTSHKDKMGNLSTLYLTIPIEWWARIDNFMLGFGNRFEFLLSQKLEGEKIEDSMKGFRDSFYIDGVWTCGNLDLGGQLLLNLTNAFSIEDYDWSPTIGIVATVGYRF